MDDLRRWLDGWVMLLAPDRLPGWQRLGRWERGRLRLLALLALAGQRQARLLLWFMLGGTLLMRSLCWRRDLQGWPAELLLSLPALLVAPLLLRRWHRALLLRLRRQRRR